MFPKLIVKDVALSKEKIFKWRNEMWFVNERNLMNQGEAEMVPFCTRGSL